jgi:hypothetical protein
MVSLINLIPKSCFVSDISMGFIKTSAKVVINEYAEGQRNVACEIQEVSLGVVLASDVPLESGALPTAVIDQQDPVSFPPL